MVVNVLIVSSWLFLILGVYGISKYKNFYNKLLTSSKIDTATTILLVSGLILKMGYSKFSVKLIIILVFLLLTNPVSTYLIGNYSYIFKKVKE